MSKYQYLVDIEAGMGRPVKSGGGTSPTCSFWGFLSSFLQIIFLSVCRSFLYLYASLLSQYLSSLHISRPPLPVKMKTKIEREESDSGIVEPQDRNGGKGP